MTGQMGLNPNIAAPASQNINAPQTGGSVSGARHAQDFTRLITHIEIRRVQNGFILMGFDFEQNPATFSSSGAKVCMVANDGKELGALIENIINGSDLNWLPSMDIPITGMFAREKT
jgi:hypothetical protein